MDTCDVFGIAAASGHYLGIVAATSVEARLLDATRDVPLFVVWPAARLADGRLVETNRTVWLGSRVRFHYASWVVTGQERSRLSMRRWWSRAT